MEEDLEDAQGLGLLLVALVVVGDLAALVGEEDQGDAQGLGLLLAALVVVGDLAALVVVGDLAAPGGGEGQALVFQAGTVENVSLS